ncbi:transient receptor potential cation channel subfamily A member 1-like [Haliotis rufescens]|uniref:transient receptor potential cation channel subfamily A member 1-like n=1 Tax=Haliotis rufescens TaxID=6454 RepID=UPI00201ECD75|nr:transient receptor potential cation channel subfamily A member 1-like [Haliotis rufescens]
MVKRILSEGQLDVNSRDRRARTPVMAAACAGHGGVVNLLINKGSNVSLVDDHDRQGNNILHYTCAGGHVEMVQYVLSLNKVDINSRGHHRWTSVMVAARLGNREMFDLLISKGCDVSNGYGCTNILHAACIGGHLEIVKYVISLDLVDINSRKGFGKTPLMVSALRGDKDVFDFVLSKGGNMSMVTKRGMNILHLVCQKGNLDMVKFILSKDLLEINVRTNEGVTATLIAKRKKNIELYDFLVSNGGQ